MSSAAGAPTATTGLITTDAAMTAPTGPASSYDLVPYPNFAFPQTHPDHLAVQARLFGLTPVPAAKARVLEIGCAGGGNLLPLAVAYPEMDIVGIDLSPEQIKAGRAVALKLGLANLDLRPVSVADVDASWGEFDYILCHGVYSWVPPEVQDKILAVCAEGLSPAGVAYVSYNTLPGWHTRGTVRDMMGYHTARLAGQPPSVMVAQARELLRFVAETVRLENSPYGQLLERELKLLQGQPDSYLFHEHLEEDNEPLYFSEFYSRLVEKGLRYLGESDLSVMLPINYPPEAQAYLRKLAPNQAHMEQYLDFLRNRTFRQTLICRGEHAPDYNLSPDRLSGLSLTTALQPAGEVNFTAGEPATFRGRGDVTLTTRDPLLKATVVTLAGSAPGPVAFEDLAAAARSLIGGPADEAADRRAVGMSLLTALAKTSHAVEVWADAPAAAALSGRPTASPYARHQAGESSRVTNLRHRSVTLTDFDRHLLPLLDGKRGRQELLYALGKAADRKQFTLRENGQPVTDAKRQTAVLAATLEAQLPRIAKAALLVS